MKTESGEVLGQASARVRDEGSCGICDLLLTNKEGVFCVCLEDKTQKRLSVLGGVLRERAVRLCKHLAYTEPGSEEKDRKVHCEIL